MKAVAAVAALSLIAASVIGGAAAAQTAPPVGARVKDSQGKAVGQVERIVAGRPDGKPLQVMVRVDRVLRTLPVESLTPSGADYVCVLTRAEIASLPPSE